MGDEMQVWYFRDLILLFSYVLTIKVKGKENDNKT